MIGLTSSKISTDSKDVNHVSRKLALWGKMAKYRSKITSPSSCPVILPQPTVTVKHVHHLQALLLNQTKELARADEKHGTDVILPKCADGRSTASLWFT